MTAGWAGLADEIARWRAANRIATLWWRDDDAVAATPALARLLQVARDIPVTLAVVPAGLEPSLRALVVTSPQATVAQHGWRHLNHRPPGERAAELGPDRPLAVVRDELTAGRERLMELFGSRFTGMLVPPWNRIADPVADSLLTLGFRRLSTFGPRPTGDRFRLNAHVDPIAWRHGRAFIGVERALARLSGHLADRREGRADPTEPTGILTHHLVHDAGLWAFLTALVDFLADQPGVAWVAPD